MLSRRTMITNSAVALAGGTLLLAELKNATAQQIVNPIDRPRPGTALDTGKPAVDETSLTPAQPDVDYTPVITPNGMSLPWKIVDGVKVFHLIAEEVEHEFAPGLKAKCWGYNGRTSGPTIEAAEGDRVRIYVTNRLPEPTSVHWHGVLLPNGMDGVAGLNQKPIPPGETFKYEFTLRQHGTHMYHPHFDEMTQMALGMMGMFVIHPRLPKDKRPNRDFAIMLSEWRIEPGTMRPNPMEMTNFNIFTMNSKAFPGTEPLVIKLGERVKIRLGNLSAMDHHPIHLHGYDFILTELDGGDVPEPARVAQNTVLVGVGQTRAIEFMADEPGDWAMHCHMTHHVMNQMGHDTPNMIGVRTENLNGKVQGLLPGYMTMGEKGMGDMVEMAMPVPKNSIPMLGGKGPFGVIDMGGMFTILKIRRELASYQDPGWYDHPSGTLADTASADELRKDSINVQATTKPATASALYTCPMHPEVVSDKPGKCPKCGMTLVMKK
jgi:FtsP/CotA-like multicopper oxidase with cupredoxin domain